MIRAVNKNTNNETRWERLLDDSVTSPGGLPGGPGEGACGLEDVISRYPMRVNPYYMGLIREKGDPLYLQAVPDVREITDTRGLEDPLHEEALSPVPGLTQKYPDRVLFLVSGQCAVYCRFCNRKRKVGRPSTVTPETIREGMAYIRSHKTIRDVLLSGGDPLLLDDRTLIRLLTDLRSVSHVQIIRIGTRVPCTLPQRVTPDLADILKAFHPLYINTHFNHPDEITAEAALACARLADAGIPLGCQTVLLRGVNDDPSVMKKLMQQLLTIRVRPYYLFQADLVKGTAHFWTPLNRGIRIMKEIQGHTSGLCVPHFAVDLPEGGGKVPLLPDYVLENDGKTMIFRNYLGKTYRYPGLES